MALELIFIRNFPEQIRSAMHYDPNFNRGNLGFLSIWCPTGMTCYHIRGDLMKPTCSQAFSLCSPEMRNFANLEEYVGWEKKKKSLNKYVVLLEGQKNKNLRN